MLSIPDNGLTSRNIVWKTDRIDFPTCIYAET